MPEIRQNPLTGQWVLFAPERAKRPLEHTERQSATSPVEYVETCHFCPGHENRTPPEVFALREAPSTTDGPGWSLRVFPNKFPAVTPDAPPVPQSCQTRYDIPHDRANTPCHAPDTDTPALTQSLRVVEPGIGLHEVLVESPSHCTHLAIQSPAHVERIVDAMRHRTRMMMQSRSVRHVCVFKNRGRLSGSSLEHPHMQIIGTAIVPPFIKQMIEREAAFAERHGRTFFDALIETELAENTRIVAGNELFVALAPWAAQASYEVWIVPREHLTHFENLPDDHIPAFAQMLQHILHSLFHALGDPAYNFVIHNTPQWQRFTGIHRWFLQISPRLFIPAGFESGTNVFINPVTPEQTALTLAKNA